LWGVGGGGGAGDSESELVWVQRSVLEDMLKCRGVAGCVCVCDPDKPRWGAYG
jgi:hypothetical protein